MLGKYHEPVVGTYVTVREVISMDNQRDFFPESGVRYFVQKSFNQFSNCTLVIVTKESFLTPHHEKRPIHVVY